MQKTRSILFLREVVDQLEHEEDTDIARSASFRNKDLQILSEQCQNKYKKLAELALEKQRLDHRLLELKEQLCELNPEALEEIERDCEQKNNGHSDDGQGAIQKLQGGTKTIKKKNDKKRRRKQRLYYD